MHDQNSYNTGYTASRRLHLVRGYRHASACESIKINMFKFFHLLYIQFCLLPDPISPHYLSHEYLIFFPGKSTPQPPLQKKNCKQDWREK